MPPKAPLGPSKKIVYGPAGLFGMDSFGTGFLVQSLLGLWLYQRFQVSVTTTASILFWSGLCSAVSYLIAVPIASEKSLPPDAVAEAARSIGVPAAIRRAARVVLRHGRHAGAAEAGLRQHP